MLIEKTLSLCPECVAKIPAEIHEENGRVVLRKRCKEHGTFEDVYWEDANMFHEAKRYAAEGRGIENPNVENGKPDCPFDCGLCKSHKTHTTLANIVVTNRCDLACWYCFFYAKKGDSIYEPSLEQIRGMLRTLKAERPVAANAVQFTGGEPALRPDIIEIIKIAKEEGFGHVQFNTNGIRLANDPGLANKLRAAGVNTVYLSFDGVTPKTNPKNHWEIPRALENCRKAGIGVVLVPTIIRSVNDHEVGDILRFAIRNLGVVRGINFQPVSLVGKMPRAHRERMRITNPGVVKALEVQTAGSISGNDFYPVPCTKSVTHFAESLSGRHHYDLSVHHACGLGTYVFIGDNGEIVPITRFVDVQGFFELLDRSAEELRSGKSKTITKLKLLYNLGKFIDTARMPKKLNLVNLLYQVLVNQNYKALSVFHHRSLFIGMMHFQDLYNYDIKRVMRCGVHYATPDGKIIPFCAFNVIPQFYRDELQPKFSVPAREWERIHKHMLSSDRYIRKPGTMKNLEEYYKYGRDAAEPVPLKTG